MYPAYQSFLVLGLSRSGVAAADFLLSKQAEVFVYDDVRGGAVQRAVNALVEKGAKSVREEDLPYMLEKCDALVLSPGIPVDHKLAVAFRRRKKAVIGETELAARYLKCCIIAVTGTNGKTTTVSMIADILTADKKTAKACGNIGTPMLLRRELSENDVAVAEISSFQLETLSSLRPHIAAVLNISEDHLNRHYNMENYVYLKSRLLKNCAETEYAVLNRDDEIVRTFADKTKARIVWFSRREKVNGAYVENGDICFNGERVVPLSALSLPEEHNIENALAAVACAKIMRASNEAIRSALQNFKGAPHRIEVAGTVDGVTYIDDSKGTNVDSTLRAAQCMKNDTVLLLGGKDKGYDYAPLFSALKTTRVVRCVLYGENAFKLLESAMRAGYGNVTLTEKFDYAVKIARLIASPGQTVLLSPASASFDEFSSYEERGDTFVSVVRAWQNEELTTRRERRAEQAEKPADETDNSDGAGKEIAANGSNAANAAEDAKGAEVSGNIFANSDESDGCFHCDRAQGRRSGEEEE
ncbi:MAG: UDP-N-acetylmuramoyl-L-alanine--D-glutamate ligase [Candidatus Borkfalkiaceae bacterium]|nr:UDP-N-acetylmuramoyl-L-alanine--D-glutamate ligase [Clostridia bacterium]MDY6223418.1 UDP-N-acetylmuramoyl-L-alanine--D-glutamate ligase [Christensenellaceae bacterium]